MLNAENAADHFRRKREMRRERAREWMKEKRGKDYKPREKNPTEKAMRVLELFDSGKRNFSKIAKEAGLSRARAQQIAATIGIKAERYARPILQKTCPVCQVTFTTKRENQIYCTRQCEFDYKFIREPRKVCRLCRTTEDLVKSGKLNFKQQYVCRTCVKKRIKKYGFYHKKDDPKWVEKKRKYYREYHRKRRARLGDKP